MQRLLGPLLHHLTPAHASYVAGREFFPHLITAPFHSGLGVAFGFAIAANVIAAIAPALTGKRRQLTAAPSHWVTSWPQRPRQGGFEPAELVAQDEREDSQASGP